MKPNWPKQIMRILPWVLALYALASGGAVAMCSSTSFGAGATVTCNQTTDLVIVSQSAGLWYHTGAAIGTGPYDWDSTIAGEQSIASGGTIEVTFSAGGGQLKMGNDVTPADALIGTVMVRNSIFAGTQAFLDALVSTSASTYTIDDGPGTTKVNQLNFYDDDSVGLELLIRTGSAADTVNVLSVYGNDTLYVEGNDGTDHVNLGNAGSVQSIQGPVTMENVKGVTAVTIDDHADAMPRAVTITAAGVSGIAPAPIKWHEYGVGLGAVVLNTGTANDTVNLLSIPNVLSIANPSGQTSLTIQNTSGSDIVFVGDAGSVQSIEAPVSITGYGALVDIDDSADPLPRNATYSSTGISGLSPRNITWAGSGIWTVVANFGSGNNIVHVVGSPGNAFAVSNIIDLGSGNDECYINGSGLGGNSNNVINGGGGDDLFVISAVPKSVQALTINGGPQPIGDKLVYTSGSATGAFPGNGTLMPTDPNARPIDYTSIEVFSINDVIFISGFE